MIKNSDHAPEKIEDYDALSQEEKQRRLMHWQGVALLLCLYDALAVNLASFLSLWSRFD